MWNEFKNKETFRNAYKYCFDFVKEIGVRNVEIDLGISMIEMLLKQYYGEHCMDTNIGLIIKFLRSK